MSVQKRVEIHLNNDTTLDDVEALVAEARSEFGEDTRVSVGAWGANGVILLFATPYPAVEG